mmetsp:Transcript_42097/g.105932  ORF Transcript_42097/g.105932 Transcript_42097/m.105932 type:complete len:226 (-) Transcript_42097:1155-1832(-)
MLGVVCDDPSPNQAYGEACKFRPRHPVEEMTLYGPLHGVDVTTNELHLAVQRFFALRLGAQLQGPSLSQPQPQRAAAEVCRRGWEKQLVIRMPICAIRTLRVSSHAAAIRPRFGIWQPDSKHASLQDLMHPRRERKWRKAYVTASIMAITPFLDHPYAALQHGIPPACRVFPASYVHPAKDRAKQTPLMVTADGAPSVADKAPTLKIMHWIFPSGICTCDPSKQF